MNIELRRRIDPFLSRVSSSVNDNAEERPNAPPRRRVIIFKTWQIRNDLGSDSHEAVAP
jgi:hypothetical protein